MSFNVDSKQYFFTVILIVTYEFIYCRYNSLFKQVVSGDRRARAVAQEKSKWYRSLSRGAAGVLNGDNWLSEEPWRWGVFGAATKAEFLPRQSRKQESSSPNFDQITLQTLFLMQQMLIFSVSTEEYKV